MVASAPSPLPLNIDVVTAGDRATVALDGEIDLATQADLRRVLTDLVVSGQIHLTVDLTGVSFIDSTGLGV
ncbi:MAG: STAS domain-containing protein, partial [Nocardioidaceae bacterium]